ncbi:hypothetical protein Q5P01_017997 [Channa striata]|uniref:Uncharacterized protein n=1 Tax=Channa striata TaxID=64152 RepID=A0AA88M4F1_CHASR|nr:hypothetical protein Q5P01_017997 [Channa striata]
MGLLHLLEHPAAEGILEVMMVINEEIHFPIYVSSDDEEAEISVVIDGDDAEGILPVSSDDEDDHDDEDLDDSDYWSGWSDTSEFAVESGYESMSSELDDGDNRDGSDGDEESDGEVKESIYDDNLQLADSGDIPPPDIGTEYLSFALVTPPPPPRGAQMRATRSFIKAGLLCLLGYLRVDVQQPVVLAPQQSTPHNSAASPNPKMTIKVEKTRSVLR